VTSHRKQYINEIEPKWFEWTDYQKLCSDILNRLFPKQCRVLNKPTENVPEIWNTKMHDVHFVGLTHLVILFVLPWLITLCHKLHSFAREALNKTRTEQLQSKAKRNTHIICDMIAIIFHLSRVMSKFNLITSDYTGCILHYNGHE